MMTEAERLEIARDCYADPVMFCKTFLPHIFPTTMPWFHRGMLAILTKKTAFLARYGELDKIYRNFVYKRNGVETHLFKPEGPGLLLDDAVGQYIMIMIPRGFSKTMIGGVAVPLYNTAYLENPFTVYVSETATHASMQLENVKNELIGNEKFIEVYGRLQPDRSDPARWTQEFFETTTGIAMAARGRGGQIRGLNHHGNRPRQIICDDLEDEESVKTEEQRDKTRKWAYGSLMPALQETDPGSGIVALGTLLHPDSLLMTFMKDPAWACVVFGAHDKDGELLWEFKVNEKKLEQLRESAILSGTLQEYYLERHSRVVYTENNLFQDKHFYAKTATRDEIIHGVHSLYMDPAISSKERADDLTLTVVSITEKGQIVIRESTGGKGVTPREAVNQFFDLWEKYKPEKVGIEANGYQAALIHLMKEEMFRRGKYFVITPVTHSVNSKKEQRIKGILQPRFAAGFMEFDCPAVKLKSQLLDFPHGKHDDYPDGLAGAVSLLDQYAGMAHGGKDEESNVIDLAEMIGGNWRRAV